MDLVGQTLVGPVAEHVLRDGVHSGGLYRTVDGGRTRQRIGREGRQTFGGYFHPKHDGWIYMTLTEGAPGAGLWLTRDNGRTWEPFDDLPFSNIQRVVFDPANNDRLYVTTFGGSVWRGPVVPGAGQTRRRAWLRTPGRLTFFRIELRP